MSETFPYVYDASPLEIGDYTTGVIDGDSIWLQLDLGFYIWKVDKIRLEGVDTREIHFVSHDSDEYQRGQVHRDFVIDWMETARANYDGRFPLQVGISTYDATGKYGRLLGYLQRKSDGEVLNDRLLAEFDDVDEY